LYKERLDNATPSLVTQKTSNLGQYQMDAAPTEVLQVTQSVSSYLAQQLDL
jgi:hypothetical protein